MVNESLKQLKRILTDLHSNVGVNKIILKNLSRERERERERERMDDLFAFLRPLYYFSLIRTTEG